MFASLRSAAARAMPLVASASRVAIVAPRVAANHAMVARLGQVQAVRGFSNSFKAWAAQGDKDLAAKLADELTYEKEQDQAIPDDVAEYLKNTPFTIQDNIGTDEVILTRKFGNEDIKIVFSVSDLSRDEDDEGEFDDESGDQVNSNNNLYADDRGNEEEGDDDQVEITFPVRAAITITKPNAGSINIDAVAQDGAFMIESIAYVKDSEVAAASTAEADWSRRGLYNGPPFAELDDSLQEQFENYLIERNIDSELASFLPNYVFHKDQVEYISWLGDLEKFVKAK